MSVLNKRPGERPAKVARKTATWLVGVALAAVAGVACGGTVVTTTRISATGQPAAAGAPSPSASAASSAPVSLATIVLTEADNGKTVTVARNEKVRLELHSTYWMISGSGDLSVLRPTSGVTVSPSPGCVPGQGCGTVVANYRTVGDGGSQLVASRVTCGEALACTPSDGSFAVTVIVQG